MISRKELFQVRSRTSELNTNDHILEKKVSLTLTGTDTIENIIDIFLFWLQWLQIEREKMSLPFIFIKYIKINTQIIKYYNQKWNWQCLTALCVPKFCSWVKDPIIDMHGPCILKIIFWKCKIIILAKIKYHSPIMYNSLSENANKAKNPKSVRSTQPETKNVLDFCSSSRQSFPLPFLQLPHMLLSALV